MYKITVLGFFFFMVILSCKKDSSPQAPVETCIAGPGGNVTIVANLKMNGAPVFSQANYLDSAYIRYNASSSPGNDPLMYNYIVSGNYAESKINITGLKCGPYYLFVTGYDTTSSSRVTGGIPVIITQTSGELQVDVAVN